MTDRTVDVTTSVDVARPLAEVATYVGDPGNAPEWYANIRTAAWESEPPLAVGSRLRFEASFLGRTLRYTYEVTELVPDERLAMSTVDGPFPMETIYTWEPLGPATTRVTLRNRGRPAGFSAAAAPLVARAMRRANTADLRRLRDTLESR